TGQPSTQQPEVTEREPGVLVAVRVDGDTRESAVAVLRRFGALDLEQTTGDLRDGHWYDLDPHAVDRRLLGENLNLCTASTSTEVTGCGGVYAQRSPYTDRATPQRTSPSAA